MTPAPRGGPEELADAKRLIRRSGTDAADASDVFFFEKLVAPLLPHAKAKHWILIPHRELHAVPLAALRDGRSGRRLAEMKTLSYLPSASTLRFLDGKKSPFTGRAAVFGDPATSVDGLRPLPWARREALDVAELLTTEAALGEDASEARLRLEARAADVLHIASHGFFRPQAPGFSYLALAPGGGHDGHLEVAEILYELDLGGVNLVTLSACETGLGERTAGDDITGLTRAFLYAGSPAVVSSLWRTDDRSTAFLMTTFYRLLLEGTTYAEALRRAQLETAAQPGWSAPYYWAALTLTGDGDSRWVRPAVEPADE